MSTPDRTMKKSWRTVDVNQLSNQALTVMRVVLAVTGVLAIVLGAVVLAQPDAALAVLAVLFGLYFLVSGVVRVALGIFAKGVSGGMRALGIVLGLLLVAAGIIAILNPLGSLAVLGILIGIAWIIEGVIVLSEPSGTSSRWVGIALGILSILAGIAVLLAPVIFVGLLVVIAGIALIVLGVLQVVRAIMLRAS